MPNRSISGRKPRITLAQAQAKALSPPPTAHSRCNSGGGKPAAMKVGYNDRPIRGATFARSRTVRNHRRICIHKRRHWSSPVVGHIAFVKANQATGSHQSGGTPERSSRIGEVHENKPPDS